EPALDRRSGGQSSRVRVYPRWLVRGKMVRIEAVAETWTVCLQPARSKRYSPGNDAKRYRAGRWQRHPTLSHHLGNLQTAGPHLRQAARLLPALGLDAGGHS